MSDFDVMTREFEKRLDLYDDRVVAATTKALDQNGQDLWKESANLVPKDEGTLEGSGYANPPKKRGGTIEVTVGYNTPYAAKVHETMLPAVPVGGEKQMHPGPTTESKPPTEFGEAGGKYLERPLFGKATRYAKRIAEAAKGVK